MCVCRFVIANNPKLVGRASMIILKLHVVHGPWCAIWPGIEQVHDDAVYASAAGNKALFISANFFHC